MAEPLTPPRKAVRKTYGRPKPSASIPSTPPPLPTLSNPATPLDFKFGNNHGWRKILKSVEEEKEEDNINAREVDPREVALKKIREKKEEERAKELALNQARRSRIRPGHVGETEDEPAPSSQPNPGDSPPRKKAWGFTKPDIQGMEEQSSSLPPLTSSDPAPYTADAEMEETFPVRKAGGRRVIPSPLASTSRKDSRTRRPNLASSDSNSDEEHSQTNPTSNPTSPIISRATRKKTRQISSDESENELPKLGTDPEITPGRTKPLRRGVKSPSKILDRPARRGSPDSPTARYTSKEPGMSDSDEEYERRKTKGKVKPLTKKEQKEVSKMQAEIRANKAVNISARHTGQDGMEHRPKNDMNTFFTNVEYAFNGSKKEPVVKDLQPMTAFNPSGSISQSSAVPLLTMDLDIELDENRRHLKTPEAEEDIERFSSSGVPGSKKRGKEGRIHSSPTRQGRKGELQFRSRDEEKDDHLPGLDDGADRLRRIKLETAARDKALEYQRQQEEHDDDDEIEIVDEPTPKAGPSKKNPRMLQPSASAILHQPRKVQNGMSAHQKLAALAGKDHKKMGKVSLTSESMLQYAGKQYAHAEQKSTMGGALPRGMDGRKVQSVSAAMMNQDLLLKQRMQAALAREQKEKESGMKARRLEDKKPIDLTGLAAMASAREGVEDWDVKSENDDEEDEDYKPEVGEDGTVPEDQSDQEEDAKSIAYSGEEDNVPAEDELQYPSPVATEADEEAEGPVPRKSRKIRERIRDSDDDEPRMEEQRTPRPLAKASSMVPVVPAVTGEPNSSSLETLEADIGYGGFDADGDEGLGGGFSQFFGATQAPAAGDEDFGGFTQLRHDDAETLLAPQVDMPDPSISATARRRNEALLEGEMELDTDAVEAEPVLVKQYINQNGLLTQTRPFGRAPLTKADTSISLISDDAMTDLPSMPLTATYRSGQPGSDVNPTTPSEGSLSRRYKSRQASPGQVDEPELDSPIPSSQSRRDTETTTTRPLAVETPQPKQRNALTDVLEAAKRFPKADAATRAFGRTFLEGEAEESEDENDYGWGGKKRDDDEDEDADPDAVVENLVDDKEISEQELQEQKQLADKLLREIQAEDDSKAEKLARDATEGKLRGRQRDGALGEFDLSDDEDESQRKRKREHRKYERKLENDELRHMAPDAPFRHTYEADLAIVADDDDEEEDMEDVERIPVGPSRERSPSEEVVATREDIARRFKEAGAENKLKRKLSIVSLDDTDHEASGSENESQFTIKRYSSQQIQRPPLPSRDTAKFEKYAVEQRTQDTRKVGGMTAVSGNSNSNRAPVRRNANPSRKNTKSLVSSRTETRSLTKVMSKADGFV